MALQKSGLELAAEGASQYISDLGRAEAATDSFLSSASTAGDGFSSLREIGVGALREIGAAAISAGVEVAKGLAAGIGSSINVAGDFEAGMNQFGAAAGDALAEAGLSVDDFRQQFLDLGKELPVSTTEVQQAAIALIKGGLDPAVVAAGGLRDSLLFAAAAEMDLAAGAELGIKMLSTFGPAAGTAAEKSAFLASAQDLLVRAAGASTLDVAALGDAMLASAGAANAAGVDYQDFVTTLTLTSGAFGSAAEAGTGYKNFLARLQPTTDPAAQAMARLGLYTEESGSAFFDAQGNFVGGAQAAELLQNALAPLTDEQRSLALQTIFGNDAMGTAAALAQQGAEGYATLAENIEAAGGVQEQAAAKQAGFNTALDNFWGSVEVLQITVGSKLLPILTELFNNVLSPGVNVVTTLAEAVFGSQEAFAALPAPLQGVATAITGAVDGLFVFLDAAGSIYDLFTSNDLGTTASAFQNLIGLFGPEAAGAIGDTVSLFRELFDALSQGDIGGALATVAEAVGSFAQDIGTKIAEAAPGVLANLQQIGEQLIGWAAEQAPAWGASLAQLGGQLAGWVAENLPGMIGGLADARTALVTWVLDSLPEWAANLQELGGLMMQWVVDALPGLGTNLGQVAALLITKTGEFIAEVGPRLLELAGRFVMWVAEEVLPELPGQLANVASALVAGIGNFLEEIGPPLLEVATAFLEWVTTEVLPKAPGELAKIGSAIVSGISEFAGNVVAESSQLGADLIAGFVQGVQDAAGSLYNAVAGVIAGALGAGKDEAETGSPSRLFARELGLPVSQGIAIGITEGLPFVASAIQGVTTGALGAAQAMPDKLASVAELATEAIAEAFGQGTGAIVAPVEGWQAGMDSAFGRAASAAVGDGKAIADGLARGISQGTPAAAAAAAKLASAATSSAKAKLKIASPSQVFADEVGAPITQGIAAGMLDNLGTLLDAASKISKAVLDEAQGFAATIQDAVAPLFQAAFQGAADFARGQIGALDSLDALAPDTSELERRGQETQRILDQLGKVGEDYADKRAKLAADIAKAEADLANDDAAARRKALQDELQRLEGETKGAEVDLAEKRRRLQITASQNYDPEKRAEAARELAELDASAPAASDPAAQDRIRAIKEQLAAFDRGDVEAAATARQAEIDRIAALRAELAGLSEQEAERRAAISAEAALSAQRYKDEETRIQRLQAIQDRAQTEMQAAQTQALTISDASERAQYLGLRTKQIAEQAQLEQRLVDATTQQERDRLQERMKFLKQAQQNEFLLYQQEAKQRQADTAAALRDAEQAAKILGGLVYFSQEDVFGTGQDAIKGVAEGMLSQLGMLSSTLGGVLDGALAAARRQLGINSPSKVAAELLGEPFVEGIGQAVAAGRAMLADASTYAVGGLLLAPAQQVSAPASPNYSYATSTTYNTPITLDLRGVSAGDVGAIEAAVARGLAAAGIRADTLTRMA